MKTKINEVQKQIGAKKKAGFARSVEPRNSYIPTNTPVQAKENADELLQQKIELEREYKTLVESATEKDRSLQAKVKSIGNYVHDSVPVSDNEVRSNHRITKPLPSG